MDLYLDIIKSLLEHLKKKFFFKVQHCFVLKYEVARVFNSLNLLELHRWPILNLQRQF